MFQLSIHCPNQHQQLAVEADKIVLGSGTNSQTEASHEFVVVEDTYLASRQLQLIFDPKRSLVKLSNYGRGVIMQSGQRVLRDKGYLLTPPTRISIGQTVIEIIAENEKTSIDDALTVFDYQARAQGKNNKSDRAPSVSKLSLWFEAIAEFQKNVAGTRQFFLDAARCAFDPGGLDGAMVLCPESDSSWQIVASYIPSPELGIAFQPSIVKQVAETRQTMFHDAGKISEGSYRNDTDFVIAAPVCDSHNRVTAVLYATRSMKRANNRIGIRAMEAHFIHLIAESVSSGLRRLETESKAARDRALLQQAFSPEVSVQLQQNPNILEPRESEVSVLFADLRGFSSIAEQAGTRTTYQLLADVMDRFTEIVMNQNGVILDYYGDGLAAFWNAPIENPHHASLASESALQMQDEMCSINESWSRRLGRNLRLGIGVHTGVAQVGNSGSRRRLKYGPRGNTVNLAQRIESCTKFVGLPFLVSNSTAAQLDDRFEHRRVCRTRVPGIREAVTLVQPVLKNQMSAEQMEAFSVYESALDAFEKRDLAGAIERLIQLEATNQNDPATEYLLEGITKFQNDRDWQSSADPATEPFEPLLGTQAKREDRAKMPKGSTIMNDVP